MVPMGSLKDNIQDFHRRQPLSLSRRSVMFTLYPPAATPAGREWYYTLKSSPAHRPHAALWSCVLCVCGVLLSKTQPHLLPSWQFPKQDCENILIYQNIFIFCHFRCVCVDIYPETNKCWCNQDVTLMAAVFHFRDRLWHCVRWLADVASWQSKWIKPIIGYTCCF